MPEEELPAQQVGAEQQMPQDPMALAQENNQMLSQIGEMVAQIGEMLSAQMGGAQEQPASEDEALRNEALARLQAGQ